VGWENKCLFNLFYSVYSGERERVERERKGEMGIKVGEEEEGSAGGERE